jgi:hypothetical protein
MVAGAPGVVLVFRMVWAGGWSCTIQEAIHIIGFNKGQNLSSPARKVAVGQLDIQGMVHIWDGEEDVG